jgi:hypothetical protein
MVAVATVRRACDYITAQISTQPMSAIPMETRSPPFVAASLRRSDRNISTPNGIIEAEPQTA